MVGAPAPWPASATDAPTSRDTRWTVLDGDSLQLLCTLDSGTVDAVVCDPPYGIDFCGQRWDGQAIRQAAAHRGQTKLTPNEAFQTWCRQWAGGCLTALKPGGHLAAFGSPRTFHRLACALEEAGFELRDTLLWLYGTGMPKSRHLPGGRATGLKPAYEPILLARRPLDGTVEHNLACHGTGALNTDACRTSERFPANVLLSHHPDCDQNECVGECAVRAVQLAAHQIRAAGARPISRLFYCPKASRTERDAGCEQLPRRPLDLFPNAQAAGHRAPPAANAHPTVKPLELMRWLVRLITPQHGLVLDPFCGSGSTGCAAVLEHRRFLGIELDPDYAHVARARIDHWTRTNPPRTAQTHEIGFLPKDDLAEQFEQEACADDSSDTQAAAAPLPTSAPCPGRPGTAVALDADSVERVAGRVADLLAPRLPDPTASVTGKLLSAAEVSERWGVERSWVYEHASDLGAIRLGAGARPRLRFPSEAIEHYLAARGDQRQRPPQLALPGGRRSRRIAADPVELLPVRGQQS